MKYQIRKNHLRTFCIKEHRPKYNIVGRLLAIHCDNQDKFHPDAGHQKYVPKFKSR
jgi:hypothetical protein